MSIQLLLWANMGRDGCGLEENGVCKSEEEATNIVVMNPDMLQSLDIWLL
jgi:hypothetical protein